MSDAGDTGAKQRRSSPKVSSNGGLLPENVTAESGMVGSHSFLRLAERRERENLVLWKHPMTTLQYFLKELLIDLYSYGTKLWLYKIPVFIIFLFILAGFLAFYVPGPHHLYIQVIQKKVLWCLYWIGLGVLSSVGLGTGLHTFLLYLGPHIAAVTLAAHECGSLNFPQPPYPDDIICPEENHGTNTAISILNIMSKVRLEAFMWGAGTALGELPPYFMARASRLSGQDPGDDDAEEIEELLQERHRRAELSFLEKARAAVKKLVEKVGFFGILACASIPNPLFDLAGITCGHFLVPFWTFFGATLVGKAVIKMHIQKLFVIVAFNEHHVELLVNRIKYIPYIGKYLQAPLKEFLAKQKANLHRKVGSPVQQESSWLAWIFERFVIAMVAYFVLSIINSMAQSHHKRLHRAKREPAGSKLYQKVATD